MNIIEKIINVISGVGKDKLLHFIAGLLIAQIVYAVWCLLINKSYAGIIIGFVIAVAAGILKEEYDKHHRGHSFEWWDMIAVFIGAILGSGILLIVVL